VLFVAVCGTEVTPVPEFSTNPCAAPLKLGYLMSPCISRNSQGTSGKTVRQLVETLTRLSLPAGMLAGGNLRHSYTMGQYGDPTGESPDHPQPVSPI
jgi:hypothetical protein